jgi:hypothetical protein
VIKVGLEVLWVVSWIAAAALALAGLLYFGGLLLVQLGLIEAPRIGGEITLDKDGAPIHAADLFSWPVVITALLAGGVAIAGGLVVIARLRALFANFCSGAPFKTENADHLRAIWITMVVVEASRFVIAAGVGLLVLAFGTPANLAMRVSNPSIDLTTWGAILVLIVLAEVFREGARLREEQDLTV